MQIAHIVDGNLLLEKPTRVKSFHAVLEDPSFSPMGVILLSDKLPFIPVHSLVLLYRVFSAADITFHLYLIPNHRGLEKVSVPLILFTQVWWFPGCTPRSPVHVLYAVKRDRCLQTAIPPPGHGTHYQTVSGRTCLSLDHKTALAMWSEARPNL